MAKKSRRRDQTTRKGTVDRGTTPPEPVMDVWDRVAWTCLQILVVLVPVAMSNFGPFSPNGVPITYDQFDIVKVFFERGLMLVAVGAWLVGLLLRGGRLRSVRGEWLLLVFLGWVVLTSVLSIHPATAIFGKYRRFEGLISFITYGATLFVTLQLATNASRIRSLARSLAIGGFLVAFYGAIQVVGTVSVEVARVLQPAMVVLSVVVPSGLAYLAMKKGADDPDLRRACWIGVAITLFGGVMLASGLAQNISSSLAEGLRSVSLDPIRWGKLPFESHRAFSTFGNPDLLGGYLIFPFAVTLALALSEKHSLWRGIYWVFTLFNVFVGITSYVRGAWIGASVSLVVLVIAYLLARSGTGMRLSRMDWMFVGGTGIAATTVVIASSLRPDVVRNVLTRVISIFQFGQGSALTRFQIWQAALAAIAKRPIFGWGADTFRLLFPMFKPAAYVEAAGYLSVADNVHNYPLQLASGIGIPGALMMYGLIAATLVIAVRAVFAKGTGAGNLLVAGFWAAVLGYVVHLLFGLSVTGSTIMMWLSMGVLLSPAAIVREVRPPSWKSIAAGVVVAVVVVASVLNVLFIVADTHYLKGRILTQGTDRVTEIESAIRLNPYNDMYRLELGSAWGDLFRAAAGQYAQEKAQGTDDSALRSQALDLYAKATSAFESMIAYSPKEYDTYVFLSNLHNEAATFIDASFAADAVKVAERGIRLEPYGPAVRLQAAAAYTMLGEYDEAIKNLEVAAKLDSNYSQAFLRLADVYTRVGRFDDAKVAYDHVLARLPDDVGALSGLAALQAAEASATTGTP